MGNSRNTIKILKKFKAYNTDVSLVFSQFFCSKSCKLSLYNIYISEKPRTKIDRKLGYNAVVSLILASKKMNFSCMFSLSCWTACRTTDMSSYRSAMS